MSDEVDTNMITDGLGEIFTITESYMKPYPSCRHTHCGIECALDVRKRLPLGAKIKDVKVYIYKNAIDIAGQIKVPKVSDDAKFSVHYSLAVALLEGHFNLGDLDISHMSDELLRAIDSIELIVDPTMEDRDKGIRGSRVVVTTEDGTEYEKTVLIPLGDAANPLTWYDLEEKLSACSDGLVTKENQKKLLLNIHNFDKLHKIDTINLYNIQL